MLSYVMKRTLEKRRRTRLRSETYRQLLFISIFDGSYLEAISPNFFNIFC